MSFRIDSRQLHINRLSSRDYDHKRDPGPIISSIAGKGKHEWTNMDQKSHEMVSAIVVSQSSFANGTSTIYPIHAIWQMTINRIEQPCRNPAGSHGQTVHDTQEDKIWIY